MLRLYAAVWCRVRWNDMSMDENVNVSVVRQGRKKKEERKVG